MNKFLVLAFFCTVLVASNAQFFGGNPFFPGGNPFFPGAAGGVGVNPWPQIAIDKTIQQIRDTPVTEEFQPQIDQTIQELEDGIAACEDIASTTNIFWIYKKCIGFQIKKAQNQAIAIQAASDAAAAAATTPAPQ